MELQSLYNKKQELENEYANSIIKNTDYDEIAKLVSDYEEKLIENKKQEYAHNQELIKSKIDLINELIYNEEQGNY